MTAKTPLGATALLLATVATASAQTPTIETFRQMERQLAAAYMKGDRQFVDDLLADDWTSISYRGELWTKARVLAMFDGARPPMSKNEIEVDNVRVLGDVAIVTGRSLAEGRVDGHDISIEQRYTDIYVKRDGRWRVVSSQGTQGP